MGRAIALAYLAEGARVTLTAARERAELDAVAQAAALAGQGERIHTLIADVTEPADCERVVRETLERFGRLDVLVNNAGRGMKYVSPRFMSEPPRFWEVTPETWALVIATNVNGPFFMTRAALPTMLAHNAGSVINVSMNYETMKRRGFSPYGPSKAALESASAIWAQDLEGTGVRLNELLPGGATATGMIPSDVAPEVRERLLAPAIVAAPAIYLASPRSQGVNGRRLVATEWTPAQPNGRPIVAGIGG